MRLLLLLLLTLPAVVQAQFNYITNSGTITITGYTGPDGGVAIPVTINGLPVISIGDYAFINRTSLTSITIPSSVASIGNSAFNGCNSLTDFTIPDSVTGIGNGVLGSCDRLRSVTIGSGVTNIGSGAFGYCTSLTEITIPGNVTSIGQAAFTNCTSLVTLKIGSGVTSMGDNVCSGCTSLTNITVDADNSIYGSVDGILVNKSQTTLIRFPQGKTGSYTIPGSVTNIGRWAFQYCTGLTGVTLPSNVTIIRENAFSDCISLKGVYFLGRAPRFGSSIFGGNNIATVYYLPGTFNWGPTFGGRPTALWLLPNPLILNNGPIFGVQTNRFGFLISWATNRPVVVEVCTDLAQPVWSPVGTNTLTDGASYYSDPQWTNHPARFYRLRSP